MQAGRGRGARSKPGWVQRPPGADREPEDERTAEILERGERVSCVASEWSSVAQDRGEPAALLDGVGSALDHDDVRTLARGGQKRYVRHVAGL